MFCGFSHKHSARLRALFGSNSGKSGRLPVEFDEEGPLPMIVANLVIGEAVNGQPVVRHFELTLVPLVVSVTRKQIGDLVSYFEDLVPSEAAEMREARIVNRAKAKLIGMDEKKVNLKGAKVIEQALKDFGGGFVKGAKGIGKGMKKVGRGVGGKRREKGIEGVEGVKELDLQLISGGLEEEDEEKDKDRDEPPSPASPRSRTLTAVLSSAPSTMTNAKQVVTAKSAKAKEKATKVVFQRLRVGELNVFVSYKGDSWANLEDFEDLHITLHSILHSNKVCTLDDMLRSLRKRVVLDLLKQVSRNFSNIGSFLVQKFHVKGFNCIDADIINAVGEGGGGGGTSSQVESNEEPPSPVPGGEGPPTADLEDSDTLNMMLHDRVDGGGAGAFFNNGDNNCDDELNFNPLSGSDSVTSGTSRLFNDDYSSDQHKLARKLLFSPKAAKKKASVFGSLTTPKPKG